MVKIFASKGVHPPENKDLSSDKELQPLSRVSELKIPIQQHIGAPLEPTVEKGDRVERWEKIADSEAFVSAPVHSPVSGKVKGIEKISVPAGDRVEAVIISADEEETAGAESDKKRNWDSSLNNLSADEIRNAVREAGIAGMGGAMFPTHVKLSVPEEKNIDYFILNGAECEPYLTVDHRLMVERTAKLLRGFKLLMQAAEVEDGIIAIEENKPDAIDKMKKIVEDEDNIEVEVLPSRYPQGGETVLIKSLLDREVPVGGLPLDVGVIVNNVATAAAVADAVGRGKPLVDRPLTISGGGINEPGNYIVPIGTPIERVIEEAGGFSGEIGKVVAGGPMLGKAQASLSAPVVKGTSGILVMRKDEVEKFEPDPCIKCARCVDVCPVDLMPTSLEEYAKEEKLDFLEEYRVTNCIECGSCSYICPSQRPLVHYIRLGKRKLNASQQSE